MVFCNLVLQIVLNKLHFVDIYSAFYKQPGSVSGIVFDGTAAEVLENKELREEYLAI